MKTCDHDMKYSIALEILLEKDKTNQFQVKNKNIVEIKSRKRRMAPNQEKE